MIQFNFLLYICCDIACNAVVYRQGPARGSAWTPGQLYTRFGPTRGNTHKLCYLCPWLWTSPLQKTVFECLIFCYIFVLTLHVMLLSINKGRSVGQRGSLGSCIPSLDWPGVIHIRWIISVLAYGRHHCRKLCSKVEPHCYILVLT